MKLTIEEHPDRVRRYGHLRPSMPLFGRRCGAPFEAGSKRRCTLAAGHRGPHAAHGWTGRVLAVWETGSAPSSGGVGGAGPGGPSSLPKGGAVSKGGARRTEGKSVVGLDDPGLAPPWKRAVQALARIAPSLEAGLFLVLFVAMVGFVLDWALRILGVR